MLRHWERLRDGVLGRFAILQDGQSGSNWLSGHLRIDEHGLVRLRLLLDDDEDSPWTGHATAGQSVLGGVTEIGAVLVTDILTWSTSAGYGTGCAVREYDARLVLTDVALEEVDADLAVGAQLHYYGIEDWAPEPTLVETRGAGDDPDLRWRLDVVSRPELRAPLEQDLELCLSRAFVLGGDSDDRRVGAPLRVKVESRQRRYVSELTVVLDAVQALLALASPEDVKARAGFVRLTESARWTPMWESDLMCSPVDASSASSGSVVGLDDMGGIAGVAAWVELCASHRRAVAPLVSHHLRRGQPPESRLMAVCAAIEYWVAANAREWWAQENKAVRRSRGNPAGETFADALPRLVDPAWAEWVGDSRAWASRLWTRYEALKHNPSAPVDPVELNALELAARWLLASALMDKCAGSSAPSRKLFGQRLWRAGSDIRATLFKT